MSNQISLYEKYVLELEPNGSRWKGLCPFHSEEDGSFVVYGDFGYHCFGCGAHGTFKDFLSAFEEEDNISLLGIEFIKDKEILKLEGLENDLFEELFEYLRSTSYETKSKIWGLFENIWVDLKFLEERNSLEKLLFVRKKFRQIVSEV